MDDIGKILPSLPIWLSIPIILLGWVVPLLPNITKLINTLNGRSRSLQTEKQQLEILKLRYEIETLIKKNGLEPFPEDPKKDLMQPLTEAPVASADEPPLTTWQRFIFGASGALVPALLNLMFIDARFLLNSWQFLLGYLLRILLLCFLGGALSYTFNGSRITKLTAFLLGLSTTLFVSLLINTMSVSVH